MLYHGVATEDAVLMRMNSVPRSIAEELGRGFQKAKSKDQQATARDAREFIRGLSATEWHAAAPKGASLSGGDYREVWKQLSGDG